MPLDAESIKCLDLVKRGKPAHFVMVSKGMKVLNLVAYRRGSLQSRKTQAREAGTGDVSFGVVEGGGENIVFKLRREDGFEAPPMKSPFPLREFLNKAGFSFKATYEIVDSLPDVEMEDDGTGENQDLPIQEVEPSDETSQSMTEESTSSDLKTTYDGVKARFLAMQGRMKKWANEQTKRISGGDKSARLVLSDVLGRWQGVQEGFAKIDKDLNHPNIEGLLLECERDLVEFESKFGMFNDPQAPPNLPDPTTSLEDLDQLEQSVENIRKWSEKLQSTYSAALRAMQSALGDCESVLRQKIKQEGSVPPDDPDRKRLQEFIKTLQVLQQLVVKLPVGVLGRD